MIRHILKCTRGRRQAWKAFVAPFFMHNSCLFSFGWCKRECAEALLFPFNSVHDFLGEGKRNGKEEGGLSSKQAWNIHLFISFFFFFFLASLWLCLDSISQMLFRALLPAPGAQCNSYLKNAYKKKKKKSIVSSFPVSGKFKQTDDINDNNTSENTNNQQWME